MTTTHVTALYRYPVKGLSPQQLEKIAVKAGETLAFDRAWAIENGPGRFDPEAPRHLPKINFVMLMRDEKLATLQAEFDEADRTLVLKRAGKQVAKGALETKIGRQMLEQFLAAYMAGSLRGAPKIVSAPGHSFSDVAAKVVHIVNLASVRELERKVGRPVDPIRFRPNIVIDGLPAWDELRLVGTRMRIGAIDLDVMKRTERCPATNVDPSTGARDMGLPAELQRTWGHADFGIYARIASDGELAVGDAVDAMPSMA